MEGYMDVLAAHQYGWDNAVASMGTALTEKQLSLLKKTTKNLILALDADTAGEEATLRMVETIDIENYVHAGVKVVVPSQGKDPDEEIRKDPALWAKSLEGAMPIMDYVFDIVTSKIDLKSAQDKAAAVERLSQIISNINDSTQRGHYVQKIALIARIKPNDLQNRIIRIRAEKRIRKTKIVVSPIPTKSVLLSSNLIEEYCLGLLLQFPALRAEGMKINQGYFEFNESREIFLKWQQSTDIDSIKNKLDSTLHPYLDSLLKKVYPSTIKENEDKQRKTLHDCIIRLREKLIKNLELKKAELLAIEAEIGGEKADLAKLDELGIKESKELQRIFVEQSRRRHSVA